MNRKGNFSKPSPKDLTPSKARRLEWRNICVEAYLQGNSMEQVREIAKEKTGQHSFSIATIHKYIHEAIDEWKQARIDMVDNHKAIEIAKIANYEKECWEAWEDAREAGNLKDDQYMKGIQWATEMRCKILGFDNPQPAVAVQVNQNNSNNSTTIVRRVVFKTRETTAIPQIISQSTPE